jgi:hypothetical protein
MRGLSGPCTALAGFAPVVVAGLQFVSRLNFVGVDNGCDQAWEALVDFCATGSILHFDTATFPTNQARLSQRFKVLREG